MVRYISTNGYGRVNLHDANNLTSNPIENEINIFHSLGSSGYERQYNKEKIFSDEDFKTPREKFEQIYKEQGIISRILDNIKNKIPILSAFGMIGSFEVEAILERYENGELKEFEAYSTVDNYAKNQKYLTNLTMNFLTLLTILFTISALINIDISIGVKFALTCFIGGAIRLALEKIEAYTQGTSFVNNSNNIFASNLFISSPPNIQKPANKISRENCAQKYNLFLNNTNMSPHVLNQS